MTTFSQKKSLLIVATAVSLLSIIPGCFDKKSKSSGRSAAVDTLDQDENDTSPAVVTINGKPLITQDRLEREKQNLIDSNPQVQQMIAMMPAGALDRNLAEGLANQEVIGLYVKDKGIDQSPAYKAELSRAMKSIPQALNVKLFTEHMTAAVTDGAVRAFYDANKDVIPELVVSRGGVVAQGISFTTQQEAQAFLDKVNAMNGDMQKAAQEMNIADQIEDFKQVNAQSMQLGAQLREKIMGMTTFPAVKMFNADDAFWVVKATGKEALKYREFDSIKNELRQFVAQKKAEEEMNRLRQQYNIVVDDSFFAGAPTDAQPSMDDMSMDEDMEMDQEGSAQEARNQQSGAMRTATAA